MRRILVVLVLLAATVPWGARAQVPPFLVGLNALTAVDRFEAAEYEAFARLAPQALRIWVNWRDIEPVQGRLGWDALDRAVGFATRTGIEPWLLIAGAPAFACAKGDVAPAPDRLCPPIPALFARFVRQVADRYGDRATYYEIWNEPDHDRFWTTGPSMDEYAEVLAAAYSAIKQSDPDSVVVMAALTDFRPGHVERLFERLDGRPAYDGVALHVYWWDDASGVGAVGPSVRHTIDVPGYGRRAVDLREQLLVYRSLLAAGGHVPQVWITEFGWPAHSPQPTPAYPSLPQQATFLRETYAMVRGDPELSFVRGLFWYADRDWATDPADPAAQTGFGFYGLRFADGREKPAAQAFREIAQDSRAVRADRRLLDTRK